MPSLLVPSVPFYRNPQLRNGLAALVELLMDRDYSSHAIGRIFDFVACNGTLEGSLIEEEDMADAEAAFVDALPEIAFDSPAWGEAELMPITGGAPEPEEPPFEPTGEDWADYRAFAEEIERRALLARMSAAPSGSWD